MGRLRGILTEHYIMIIDQAENKSSFETASIGRRLKVSTLPTGRIAFVFNISWNAVRW